MTTEPTVFVVDDDADGRDSVCVLVRSMGIRAEPFGSAEEFLAGYVEGRPGSLVTDIRMLGMSGIELQEKLIERNISLPVIVLTAYARTRLTVCAMAAGAVTLLEKPYDEDELWDAIRKALARDAQRREGAQRQREIRSRVDQLTPGERAVMDLIVQGQPNKTIAGKLEISVRAVENRRSAVFSKMQADSVAELVRLAIDAKLDD
ncbi:MAG: response regulator transcription factor [Rhizomicrobium sp.]